MVMRAGSVRAHGDDWREGRLVRARVVERRDQRPRDVGLAPADERFPREPLVDGVRERRRPADRG
jgi:hypothetical protein